MRHPPLRTLGLLALIVFALITLAGCQDPDAPNTTKTRPAPMSSPQNAGELPAPPPPSLAAQTPAEVQPTPAGALEAFAGLYVNWTYRTLTRDQSRLAAMSVGSARLAERQAAAATRTDTTIMGGHIYNTGQVVSIAQDRSHPGMWVIVTREQTGGSSSSSSSSEYQGLQAAYHVTLAKLAHLAHGYVIESWLPQS